MYEKQKRLLQQTLGSFQWLMKALYVRQAKATVIYVEFKEKWSQRKEPTSAQRERILLHVLNDNIATHTNSAELLQSNQHRAEGV
jgi:hypothetical protein